MMAILRKDSSQLHDYVVAMRNSESLLRTLWGALQYDSEPHAFVFMSTANKKSNLHTNCQVKVLPMGLVILGTWYRPAADTFSAVELYVRDEIPSFPNNILPLTLADSLICLTSSTGKGMGISIASLISITKTRTNSGSVLVTLITTPCPA
jgi:hypothetical protein